MSTVEHVLYTEEADTLGSERESPCSVLGSVGVGTHTQSAVLVHEGHVFYETGILRCVHGLNGYVVYETLASVE